MPGPSRIVNQAQIRFPKLGSPPTYHSFLKAFVGMPGNEKALASMDKATFDAEYEKQLRSLSHLDEKNIKSHLVEPGWKDNQKLWERCRNKTGKFGNYVGESDFVRKLKMPGIASDPAQHKTKDQMATATYQEFASKVEKRNPDVVFDRAMMDSAFKYKASMIFNNRSAETHQGDLEKMMNRCLGRESELYWKNR